MKTIFFDMDGVLCNFDAGIPYEPDIICQETGSRWYSDPKEMHMQGFFRNLPVLGQAKESVNRIISDYEIDVHIASKPVPNEFCPSEKFAWIKEHFPYLVKKTHLVQNKGLLIGHYLVDDDKRWQDAFQGTFLHFQTLNPSDSWKKVFDLLEPYRRR